MLRADLGDAGGKIGARLDGGETDTHQDQGRHREAKRAGTGGGEDLGPVAAHQAEGHDRPGQEAAGVGGHVDARNEGNHQIQQQGGEHAVSQGTRHGLRQHVLAKEDEGGECAEQAEDRARRPRGHTRLVEDERGQGRAERTSHPQGEETPWAHQELDGRAQGPLRPAVHGQMEEAEVQEGRADEALPLSGEDRGLVDGAHAIDHGQGGPSTGERVGADQDLRHEAQRRWRR